MKMTEHTGTTEATKTISNIDMGANVHISKHPLLFHKISILRSSATTPGTFRSVLKEITYHLGYEATKQLETCEVPISVPVKNKEHLEEHTDAIGLKLSDQVALIPILRSGLGMCDSMLELLPKSAVHHIGMYRMPGCAPVEYFNRLPRKCACDVAFVLDPVMGSAATVLAVVAILKKVRTKVVCRRYCVEGRRDEHRPSIRRRFSVVLFCFVLFRVWSTTGSWHSHIFCYCCAPIHFRTVGRNL
jgi:uracil phosphoribosyltransferase